MAKKIAIRELNFWVWLPKCRFKFTFSFLVQKSTNYLHRSVLSATPCVDVCLNNHNIIIAIQTRAGRGTGRRTKVWRAAVTQLQQWLIINNIIIIKHPVKPTVALALKCAFHRFPPYIYTWYPSILTKTWYREREYTVSSTRRYAASSRIRSHVHILYIIIHSRMAVMSVVNSSDRVIYYTR